MPRVRLKSAISRCIRSAGLLVLTCAIPMLRSDSGLRQVDFDVDGSVKFVSLTATTGANGGTEQNTVEVPYHKRLFMKVGSDRYLAAQKIRVTRPDSTSPVERLVVLDDGQKGTVHVAIRINGTILQEASASAPFGIAKASGRLAD
jgi:hypothetical protein